MSKIPLSVPSLKGNEAKYLNDCVEKEWVSSAGDFVNQFENSNSSLAEVRIQNEQKLKLDLMKVLEV